MVFQVRCQCGEQFRAQPQGKQIECPSCGATMTVPAQQTSAAASKEKKVTTKKLPLPTGVAALVLGAVAAIGRMTLPGGQFRHGWLADGGRDGFLPLASASDIELVITVASFAAFVASAGIICVAGWPNSAKDRPFYIGAIALCAAYACDVWLFNVL